MRTPLNKMRMGGKLLSSPILRSISIPVFNRKDLSKRVTLILEVGLPIRELGITNHIKLPKITFLRKLNHLLSIIVLRIISSRD